MAWIGFQMGSKRNKDNWAAFSASAALLMVFSAGCNEPPTSTIVGHSNMSFSYKSSSFADANTRKFAEAIEAGDLQKAITLARSLPDGLNTTGRSGQTALMLATERQRVDLVQGLIQAGANPNGGPDCSIVGLAVRLDDLTILKILLAAGADPNALLDTEPPILLAARVGAHEAIDALLKKSARIDEPDSVGDTALIVAASVDRWTTVLHLLDKGAILSQATPMGFNIGETAQSSRLLATRPEGIARDQVISRWRSTGLPWPAPDNNEVKAMLKAGTWPPKR
jgi:Ankyrin repeats (3 copies)